MKDANARRARRRFTMFAALSAASLGLGWRASATSAPARLEESDPIARNLGYRHDAAQVDARQFTRYRPGQACVNCQLFKASPGESWGACAIYGGRLVNVKAWCNAYVKKG